MAKKREDRATGKKSAEVTECDLDGGFISPVKSFKDFTIDNIRTALSKSRYVQILLSLTLIGFFLRFYNLGYNSLWLDEATTYNVAIQSFARIWQTTASGEFNPPLFYWIEHVMLAFGNNEAVLRVIPALAGVLTIPLVYFVGKEFMDRNVGIIAATAFAFSPFLVFYSQEARAYSLMLFFVTFAMIFYLRALKSNDVKDWGLFGLLSALAFWSHFYAFVIIAALVVCALVFQFNDIRGNMKNIRSIVLAIAVFTIVSLPLIVVTIQLFLKRTAGGPTFGLQGFDVVYQTLLQIAGNEISMYLLGLLFITGLAGALVIDRKKGILLVTLTVVTFVISVILSYKMPMVPRYLIFFSLVFVLGIAVSYRLFYALVNNRAIVYGFIVLLVVIGASLIVLTGYYTNFQKDDWRGFAGAMKQTAKPGDFVVVVPGYIAQPFDYYYSNASAGTLEFLASTGPELNAISSQKTNNSVYLIVTGDIYSANPGGDAIAWLQNNTRQVGSNTGIHLFVENS